VNKKNGDVVLTTVRLPRILLEKMHYYVQDYKHRTGLEISLTSLYRTFLTEGLTARGITDNVLKSHTTPESSKEVKS
jgi:hypothetical protein